MIDAELRDMIREILGMDAETIPDSLIDSPLVGGHIVRGIEREVGAPPYAERPEEEQDAMRRAAAYRIAAALLGTGTVRDTLAVTQERFGQQYSVSYSGKDTTGWRLDLEAWAHEALAPLLPRSGGLEHFGLAQGRRGA